MRRTPFPSSSSSSSSSHQPPQQILNYTIASDIQFSSSSNGRRNSDLVMNSTSAAPFLLHPPYQQQQQYLSYPLFEGPFQIIEPGSDEMYLIEMESAEELGLMNGGGGGEGGAGGLMEQQELFISEQNGIPREVLEDVFRLDDDIQAGGGLLPNQCPVSQGLSMAQYEQELVAEMERLFPEAGPVASAYHHQPPKKQQLGGSRLMEELGRTADHPQPDLPNYMNVQIKKTETSPRDAQRGLRLVEMTDSNGTTFKANYYHHQTKAEKSPKPAPPPPKPVPQPSPSSVKNSVQHRRVKELLKSPPLLNLSPAMASKIESLASGNRNLTITPVRGSSTPPPNPPRSNSTTIVIKTPKRTIASTGIPVDPTPPLPLSMDFPFPMAMIKQEPPEETPEQSATDPLGSTRIEIPVITPTSMASKQPRKQKLQSLSQCDVVFKEAISPGPSVLPSTSTSNRRIGQRPPPPVSAPTSSSARGTNPPNDFVTVTIKDVDETSSDKNAREQSRPPTPRPSTSNAKSPISSPNQARPRPPPNNTYQLKKRSPLVTHYRVQMASDRKRIPGQPVESIEILDSSEEDPEETNESSTGTATAPESEPEETPKPHKLPGNTESIQCPFCCKVFLSSHTLMLHSQNCADAVLFGNSPPKKQPPTGKDKKPTKNSTGESLLKSPSDKSPKPSEEPVQNKTPQQVKPRSPPAATPGPSGTSGSSRKRPSSQSRTSMRLSIEILATAFSIENLLVCDVCKKTFRNQEHLDVHQRIHTSPTECKFCKRIFQEKPRNHRCQEMSRAKQRKRDSK